MINWKGKTKTVENPGKFILSEVYSPIDSENTELNHTQTQTNILNSHIFDKSYFEKTIVDNFKTYNLLLHGDNLHVLLYLQKTMGKSIDLVYIDPPFMKNVSFYRHVYLRGIDKELYFKQKQYSDTWDLDSYLQFLYNRFWAIRELLRDTGSLYIHLDEDAAHYIKVILDEVFGRENFHRQIIWNTASLNVAGFKGQVRDNYIYASGILLFYSKSENYTFHPQYSARAPEFIEKKYKHTDDRGRYRITRRNNKIYLKEDPGEPITNVWNDILSFNYAKIAAKESVFYPTQKPEALLERIILTSSNPGDIVLDCFSGSGTTAAVAQQLGRKWIACDSNPNAIATSSKRLQRIVLAENVQQFVRSYQIWRQNPLEYIRDSVELRGRYEEGILNITIVGITSHIAYNRAQVSPKNEKISSLSLVDSVYFHFSSNSSFPIPFTIQYSDIPRGRKESILRCYKFLIPKEKYGELFIHLLVMDIFGNNHYATCSVRDFNHSDSD